MNITVDLDTPYLAKLDKIMNRGYATNRSEAIRQAITRYEKELDEEEMELLRIATETMVAEEKMGKRKTYTIEEIKKEFDL